MNKDFDELRERLIISKDSINNIYTYLNENDIKKLNKVFNNTISSITEFITTIDNLKRNE